MTIGSQPKIRDNPDFSLLYTDCMIVHSQFWGIFPQVVVQASPNKPFTTEDKREAVGKAIK